MDVDKVMSRLAVGLAAIALLGLGVYLLGDRRDRAPSPHDVPVAGPQGSWSDAGDAVTDPGSTVSVANAMLETVPGVPLLQPFTVDQSPASGGGSPDSALSAVGTQLASSLVPGLMNYAIMLPMSVAQQLAHELPSAVDSVTATALSADALPAF